MTLYQMSFVYREDALRFRMRITVLREQAKARRRRRSASDSSGAFWSSSSFSASRASWPS